MYISINSKGLRSYFGKRNAQTFKKTDQEEKKKTKIKIKNIIK
jgi:hypothetical protein